LFFPWFSYIVNEKVTLSLVLIDIGSVDSDRFFSNIPLPESPPSPNCVKDGFPAKNRDELYITFAKPMETTSLLIRSWDHDRNSSDKIFLNALNVVEPSFFGTPNEISTQQPISQSDPADIPIWVKNNALWWQQKQIDDSDFVSGIDYLINENIILIPETQITNGVTSDEIPSWISEVAGFWAHDAISNAEFVQAMQWLISSGVMVVA